MPLIRKSGGDTRKPDADPVSVLTALVNGNPDERWAAARAAVHVTGGVDALETALASEVDPRVREAIFTSLIRIGSAQSVNAIIPLLKLDDASIRTGALDALRAMPAAVRERLPELLNDRDSDVRILSCEIVRGLPGEEATSILCTLLAHEPEANVCAAAIEVLSEVGGADAIPDLDRCAARFPGISFLSFAIKIARDRILTQLTDKHV
ncbi:MAG: HEAT repeat domain-containing protein [Pseudomonadota bacterium]